MKPGFFVSIKTQFVLLSVLLVAVSSALWGWWSWKNERNLLYESLEGEGRQMLTSLASPIINALLYEEMGVIEEGGLLDNFIEEIKKNPSFPVLYVFVTDQNCKVLAHNDYTKFGTTCTDGLTLAALSEKKYTSALIPGGSSGTQILDIAMPLNIHGKSWGALRVGVSTEPLESELQALARRIAGAAVFFFLFGALLSYLIGLNMARPLQRLTTLMATVSTENLAVELPPRRPDEIGVLQESFHQMLKRLQRSETERERAVNHLLQSEKMASIGKIVAGVAHEVNNPLATIAACIYNLEQEGGGKNRNLEILKQGAERIERIVRQLSDFSRAGALEIQPVESGRFFEEIREFGRMTLKNRSVLFIAENFCAPSLVLNLDKGKIHQVVLNLLINAADASPDQGIVRLTATAGNDRYMLSVHDQGGGIPVELREQIFDIFYTTKPAGEGTGIGLAICKSITEMHGGNLQFESHPGDTRFTVSIPISMPRGIS